MTTADLSRVFVEFPDFTEADLPAIPAGWVDASFRQDMCPSWSCGILRILVDFADPVMREFTESEDPDVRFYVILDGDDQGDSLLETGIWDRVLQFVEKTAPAAS